MKMLKTNMYSLIIEESDSQVFKNLLSSYLFNTFLERTIKGCHMDDTNEGLRKGLKAFRQRQSLQGKLYSFLEFLVRILQIRDLEVIFWLSDRVLY